MEKSLFVSVGRLIVRISAIIWYEPIGESSISILTYYDKGIVDFEDEESRDAAMNQLNEVCLV